MHPQQLWAGASGYAFKEWKGSFYPEKIQPDAMLSWYAERLPSVEINNTFYRMPKLTVLENWAESTPKAFRFAIKAHPSLLVDASDKRSLGFMDVQTWSREVTTLNRKERKQLKNATAIEDKESYRWLSSIEASKARLPEGCRLTCICDRSEERRVGKECCR